jgi:hypothetical protein
MKGKEILMSDDTGRDDWVEELAGEGSFDDSEDDEEDDDE